MKRGAFIKLTVAATVALYLPGLQCQFKQKDYIKALAQPQELQRLCDAKTIREIGASYQKHSVKEKDKAVLINILSKDIHGKPLPENADSASVATLMEQKIQQDFEKNNTVVVNGWVLSQTEARQCALFYLTEK